MTSARPQFLLFIEAQRDASRGCQWRFLLHRLGTEQSISATDVEPVGSRSRSELLALVRGLEAIDEPGDVKLVMKSEYISRGLAHGLTQWRMQGWRWERFGQRVPIRDCDLWQRVDHALAFHDVDCHAWADAEPPLCEAAASPEPVAKIGVAKRQQRRERRTSAAQHTLGAWRRVRSLIEHPLAPAG